MTHLLLLALLAADRVPDGGVGELDAPVLIDLAGHQAPADAPLAPGTTCLTYDKAASVRDDLAAKNGQVASLEQSIGTNWPVVAIVVAAGVVGVGVAAAVGYVAGRNTR